MRRAIFILTPGLCLPLSDGAHTRRALSAMRGLEIRRGMTDGFYTRDSHSEIGCWFRPAMSHYAKDANKWVLGVGFLDRYYPHKSGRISMAQLVAEGGCYYKFLVDPSRTSFLHPGGSALTGRESVNQGERRLYDGSTLRHHDRLLYGGAVTLGIDAYLTNRIILSLTGHERILWDTITGHFHVQFGLNMKFMIH